MSDFLMDRFVFNGLQDLEKKSQKCTFRRYDYQLIKDAPNSKVLDELYNLFKNNEKFDGYDIFEAVLELSPLSECVFENCIELTFKRQYMSLDDWWLNLIKIIDSLNVTIVLGVLWTFPNKSSRKQISSRLRVQVLDRDNSTCQLCGATVSDGVKLHVDHIVPVSKGGTNDLDNLQILCEQCNLGKGDCTDLNMVKNRLGDD